MKRRGARGPVRSRRVFAIGISTMFAAPLVGRFVPGDAALTLAFIGGLCAIQGMHLLPVLVRGCYAAGVILLAGGFLTTLTAADPSGGWREAAPFMASFGGMLLYTSRSDLNKGVSFLPWKRSLDPSDPQPSLHFAGFLFFFLGIGLDSFGAGYPPGTPILLSGVILFSAAQMERVEEVPLAENSRKAEEKKANAQLVRPA